MSFRKVWIFMCPMHLKSIKNDCVIITFQLTTHVKNRSARTNFFFHSINSRRQITLGRNTRYPILPTRFIRTSECSSLYNQNARPSVWFLCASYLKHVLLLKLQDWPVLCKSWLLRFQLRFQRARFSIDTWWYCRSQGELKERIRGRKVTMLQVCRTSHFDM